MELKIGSVVISKAGRDKNHMLAVVRIADDGVYVSDGDERPLDRPKRKNLKHIAVTHYVLSDKETVTNRSLKRALQQIESQNEREVK